MTALAASHIQPGQVPGVLKHLTRLTRSFEHRRRHIHYINIYARPLGIGRRQQPLEFIVARESGFEGVACVDDAARAATLALHAYELNGNPEALRIGSGWLGFVEYMQQPDGRFVNFIVDTTGKKNVHGRTSRTGGTWWTSRAMRALAMAWRVTGDPRYLRRFRRGRLSPTADMKIKAVQALALMEIYAVQPDSPTAARICALCDAIVASRPRYFGDRAGQSQVAMWGYHQLQAVARAGGLLSRIDYIAACESTVRTLVEPVITAGFYHVYPIERNYQCAYDVSTMALGLEELYRVTGDARHRELALRCASWLDGNNPAGVPVYDARTGCCSDGITDGEASLNCGAESSIEAGMIELMRRRLRRGSRRRGAMPAPAAG